MLSDAEWFAAWERCYSRSPVERAVALLSAACPNVSEQEITRWPIGRRDVELMRVRLENFGVPIDTVAECPNCREMLELHLDITDLLPAEPNLTQDWYEMRTDNLQARFRLPNSRDLMHLLTVDAPDRQRTLLDRCVEDMPQSEDVARFALASEDIRQGIIQRMAEADPQADFEIGVSCAACQHCWSAPFDIVSFLWTELDAWAKRVLTEIHELASAYGWTETEVLTLSSWRRQIYLNLARQ